MAIQNLPFRFSLFRIESRTSKAAMAETASFFPAHTSLEIRYRPVQYPEDNRAELTFAPRRIHSCGIVSAKTGFSCFECIRSGDLLRFLGGAEARRGLGSRGDFRYEIYAIGDSTDMVNRVDLYAGIIASATLSGAAHASALIRPAHRTSAMDPNVPAVLLDVRGKLVSPAHESLGRCAASGIRFIVPSEVR